MKDYIEFPEIYDVIVVGAGHAGSEAALISAKMGVKTLLITISLDSIAQMSCNPAIGGIAKSHLVREIDALGGEMAKNIDKTGIQFRMLNTKKGPAVQAPRAQADKKLYQFEMKHSLEKTKNLSIKQDMVEEILVDKHNITAGVLTKRKIKYKAKAVILTTGTFLRGLIHIGLFRYPAGRAEEFAAERLSVSLEKLGFQVGRLKTGTPARVNKRSIDFSKMIEQKGDINPVPFSFFTDKINRPNISCYLTYTNEKTHSIISKNLDFSPLYGPVKVIKGIGPRYCPSIEDKVVKFPEKIKHQIFLEPEGLNTEEYYVNGMSSSLPEDVQYDFYRTVPGLENVEILRPAYAIEYDFVQPTELKPTLETKKIKNLFFAGQINGTSGYEEAAGQGLIAGINAALNIKKEKPFMLDRSESYIGVMIDDLITRGVDEPYRLFTARAEYRLLLRCDNADFRLMKYGYKLGLISREDYQKMEDKYKFINNKIKFYKTTTLHLNELRDINFSNKVKFDKGLKIYDLIKRPDIKIEDIKQIDTDLNNINKEIVNALIVNIKYKGYIDRELKLINKFQKLEREKIPDDFDYDSIEGLSLESKQRLKNLRPASLGQASRIMGIRPSDIMLLMVYIKKSKI